MKYCIFALSLFLVIPQIAFCDSWDTPPDPIYNYTECSSSGQTCNRTVMIVFNDVKNVKHVLGVQAPSGHCSKVSYKVMLGNDFVGETAFLAAGEFSFFKIDSPPRGQYQFTVKAKGIKGGCNQGRLVSWGVKLHLEGVGKAY